MRRSGTCRVASGDRRRRSCLRRRLKPPRLPRAARPWLGAGRCYRGDVGAHGASRHWPPGSDRRRTREGGPPWKIRNRSLADLSRLTERDTTPADVGTALSAPSRAGPGDPRPSWPGLGSPRRRLTDSGGVVVFVSVYGHSTGPTGAQCGIAATRAAYLPEWQELPKRALQAPKRSAVLVVGRRSWPGRCQGMGRHVGRPASSSIDRDQRSARNWCVRFALPAAGNPPDRLWPHHTGAEQLRPCSGPDRPR